MDSPQTHLPRLEPLLSNLIGISLLFNCLFAMSLTVNGQGQSQKEARFEAAAGSSTVSGDARAYYSAATGVKPVVAKAAAGATLIEKRAFELTNSARIENGRTPLAWDAELCRLARSYSEKMARLGFFAHVEPDGSDLRDRARTAGIRYRAIGENIAYNRGLDDPGASTVQRWMDSSAHRNNLLGREFRASAVGVFVSPEGRIYITQLFITR